MAQRSVLWRRETFVISFSFAFLGFWLSRGLLAIDWNRVWDFISRSLVIQLALTSALAAASRAIFSLRERAPRLYGWIEFGVGMLAIFLAVSSDIADSFERAVKLATGVYLLVRGHDNRINGYARLMERKAKQQSVPAEQEIA